MTDVLDGDLAAVDQHRRRRLRTGDDRREAREPGRFFTPLRTRDEDEVRVIRLQVHSVHTRARRVIRQLLDDHADEREAGAAVAAGGSHQAHHTRIRAAVDHRRSEPLCQRSEDLVEQRRETSHL